MPPSDPRTDDLARDVARAMQEPWQRIRLLALGDGRRFWLKRVERLSLRLRLQKGDPARAFEAEREGLHVLADQGIPVAEIALEGEDFLLLPDAGPSLVQVARDEGRSPADREAAFAAAGKALALLHWAGLVHGRPAVRDICWDGSTARFIDLERFSRGRRGGFWQALDLLLLAHSAMTQWADDPRWLEAALAGYGANAPDGALERVSRLARRLAPLAWTARQLRGLRPNSRELKAVDLTIQRLRKL